MKMLACLLVLALGCKSGDGDKVASTGSAAPTAPAAPGSPYAKDIEALCESVTRSGADKIEPDAKTLTIANWLAANLKTPESRKFLVEIQPLVGDAKAAALETEAKRVGLSGCALAAEWRTPPT
ncbi:MAG: hypothetical protein H0T42_18485 [Deltaproteobacteria bacterium]|nr:hypothetical protein [Deltaproteobacteria bacterium]